MRYILENAKTGAFIAYASLDQAKRAALTLGWCDYSITTTKSD